MNKCVRCNSYAINHNSHGRDGSDPDLCDVCYWRKRYDLLRSAAEIYVMSVRLYQIGPNNQPLIDVFHGRDPE